MVFQRYSVFPHLTVLEQRAAWLGVAALPEAALPKDVRPSPDAGTRWSSAEAHAGPRGAARLRPSAYPSSAVGRHAAAAWRYAQTLIAGPGDPAVGRTVSGRWIRAFVPTCTNWCVELYQRTQASPCFMITHDLSEGFQSWARALLVFDKVRVDPHEPDALRRHDHLRSAGRERARRPLRGGKAQRDRRSRDRRSPTVKGHPPEWGHPPIGTPTHRRGHPPNGTPTDWDTRQMGHPPIGTPAKWDTHRLGHPPKWDTHRNGTPTVKGRRP